MPSPASFPLSLLPWISLAAALVFAGCDLGEPQSEPPRAFCQMVAADDPGVCSMVLVATMAYVVDSAGRPVEGVAVEVSDPQGLRRRVEQAWAPAPGWYTVFTDGLLPLMPDGTPITAHFSKDGKVHAETYLLGNKGCHHYSITAPDTVRTGW